MPKKYLKTYNVILDNMDLQEYRLRPISAIMYLQDAFARFMATKGVAAYDLFAKNLYWIVSEYNMQFTDLLPFWSEEIKIEIWISEISKLKIYSDYNIYYNGEIFAKGNACWFLINTESKRPAKTDDFVDKFEIYDELALGEHKKITMPVLNEKISEINHKMNLSDIDFNNHVNNKSYLNIAEIAASNEFKKTHRLKQLSIKFIKETFLGDVINCSTYNTDVPDKYVHILTKDNVSVCEILTDWDVKSNNISIEDYALKVKSEII